MTDIPSRLFGSEPKWHFKSENELLTFFNCNFPLPKQNSWTVCQPTSAIARQVISVLRTQPFTLEDWRRLPTAGKNIGPTGKTRVRTGYFGNGHQVKGCTVSSAITAIGQTVALACDANPTKVVGSKQLLPRLQIMLDGYRKVDPTTQKKLPMCVLTRPPWHWVFPMTGCQATGQCSQCR